MELQLVNYIKFEFEQGEMPCSALGDKFKDTNEKCILLEFGAVLDYNGFHHRNKKDTISPYDYNEALEIKKMLDKAFAKIDSESKNISNFIQSLVIQVEIRKNINNFPCNSTGRTGIGKNRAENIIPSLWSDQKIDIFSYSHAILVWYGLFNFWKNVTNLPNSEVEKMKNQALEGFCKKNSPLDNIFDKKIFLKSGYLKLIDNITNDVKTYNGIN